MLLYDWAASPFGQPPPIPFDTPTLDSRAHETYAPFAVASFPVHALHDDVAALGLTYATGRGNGYRLNGLPADVYTATDPLIAILDETGRMLLDATARPPAGHEHEAERLTSLAHGLILTARHVSLSESRRYALLRRLRAEMAPATRADIATALARAYLDERLPESEISRPALRAAVSEELARDGFTIGARHLYALAESHPRLIGPYKRHGVYYYRVKPLP
jgi:hypothetical protein